MVLQQGVPKSILQHDESKECSGRLDNAL